MLFLDIFLFVKKFAGQSVVAFLPLECASGPLNVLPQPPQSLDHKRIHIIFVICDKYIAVCSSDSSESMLNLNAGLHYV